MSHGPSHGEVTADPNLTPMLDLVMQLLMYFIICAKFSGEEVPQEVILPPSQGARPIDKSEGDVLFLNLDSGGNLIGILGQKPWNLNDLSAVTDFKYWLDKRATDAKKDDNGNCRTSIIIRADKSTDYALVYKVMQMCKEKKFNRFKLRANIVG
jgi:biopolymer transport protein ExbD